EDGIRDRNVTGVQTCALPIYRGVKAARATLGPMARPPDELGAHMSIAGGLYRALERGRALDCGAVQLFLRNQRQWHARPMTDARSEEPSCRGRVEEWGGAGAL